MRTQNILLVSLLAALSGCQPETPVQQAAAPEATAAVQAPAAVDQAEHAEHAGQSAASGVAAAAPVQQAAPGTVEKPVQMAPAPVAPAPVAPVVEAKPEASAAPAVSEADAMALAKKSNCLGCHAVDRKVVGPAWKDVAAKYRGDAGAEARMMDKIAKGGSGAWGVVPMPPSPQISEGDRRTLARFILSLK